MFSALTKQASLGLVVAWRAVFTKRHCVPVKGALNAFWTTLCSQLWGNRLVMASSTTSVHHSTKVHRDVAELDWPAQNPDPNPPEHLWDE